MLLPDVNVLIYAHRAESPEHAAYARWLTDTSTGREPFGLSELVLGVVVRVVTSPRKTPTPLETALAFVDALLRRPNAVRLRCGAALHAAWFRDLGSILRVSLDPLHRECAAGTLRR